MGSHHDNCAFRCVIEPEMGTATVQIGWRHYAARVAEVARDGFTVVVPVRVAKRLSQGSKFTLDYHDETWLVGVESRNQDPNGLIKLRVRREEDLTQLTHEGEWGWLDFLGGVSLRNADPLLSIGTVCGIITILLVSPGVGDELGTSSYLAELFHSMTSRVWEALSG